MLDFFTVPRQRGVNCSVIPHGLTSVIPHGLTSVLLCVPLIIADSESVELVVVHDGFLCLAEIICIFIVVPSITEVLFKKFLFCTAV